MLLRRASAAWVIRFFQSHTGCHRSEHSCWCVDYMAWWGLALLWNLNMLNHESMDFLLCFFFLVPFSMCFSFSRSHPLPPSHTSTRHSPAATHRTGPSKYIILLTEIAGNFSSLSLSLIHSDSLWESREANHVGRVSVYCLRMFRKTRTAASDDDDGEGEKKRGREVYKK